MLQYSLVMTVNDQYAPLQEIGAAILEMMAKDRDVVLSEDDAKTALLPLLSLPPHPEVRPALLKLRDAGFRMATLTNSSSAGSRAQLEHAGIAEFFEKQLSVESLRKFKPHGEVYRWASEEMQVRPEECMLIAAHAWDVAGAAWAGMSTAFIARVGNQTFSLAKPTQFHASDLDALAERLLASRK
jgi:2-haloacid dehalogenase